MWLWLWLWLSSTLWLCGRRPPCLCVCVSAVAHPLPRARRAVYISSIKPAPPLPGFEEEPPLCICESCYEWDPPDVGAVLSLLEARGVHAADAVNAPGPEGMTALMLAAAAALLHLPIREKALPPRALPEPA